MNVFNRMYHLLRRCKFLTGLCDASTEFLDHDHYRYIDHHIGRQHESAVHELKTLVQAYPRLYKRVCHVLIDRRHKLECDRYVDGAWVESHDLSGDVKKKAVAQYQPSYDDIPF